MIPPGVPSATDSEGERLLCQWLKDDLDDSFTVIHSLPWLSSAARELAGTKAVTGEIDFLVIHAELGVLAVEVKGGVHRVEGLTFVHMKSGNTSNAVRQVRTSVHGLARWLGAARTDMRLRIGYALAFPHSEFDGRIVSSALVDTTVSPPATIVIDRSDLPRIGSRIVDIMNYWKLALSNPPLGAARLTDLVSILCPEVNGTSAWNQRAVWDNKLWLKLTTEQLAVVAMAIGERRLLVTGWPGTGKTLILAECARRAVSAGKRVLVLTFNTLLARHLRAQIPAHKSLRVSTWHSFCRTASRRFGSDEDQERNWLDDGCLNDVIQAAAGGKIELFDVIMIDEAQAFRHTWMEWICSWQDERQLLAFCDETQVFEFETSHLTLSELSALLEVKPFLLTIPIRSPKAILQKLTAVRRPECQLHSPREHEPDAMQERLVTSPRESLPKVLLQLKNDGFEEQDIVVLSKYGLLQDIGVQGGGRFETVSRFRGLESPIVIVENAEGMSDTELFCAYSRATTLCIALYNAEILGVCGPESQFERMLLDDPRNSEIVESARLASQTGEIIRANLNINWLATQTVLLGWSPQWQTWLVERRDELAGFWIDYLADHTPWPTYFWDVQSIRSMYIAESLTAGTESSGWVGGYEPMPCVQCRALTPHKILSTLERQCVRHGVEVDAQEGPRLFEPDVELSVRIEHLDKLLSCPDPKRLTVEQRQSLPLSLAAGAALVFARKNARRSIADEVEMPWGRTIYRAALALTYSMVYLLPDDKEFSVNETANSFYSRYQMPEGLTPGDLQKEIALACSVASRRGHLSRVSKGIYKLKA